MKGWKAIVWRKMGVLIFSVPDPTSHIRLRFLSSHFTLCAPLDINIKSVCKNVFNFPRAKRNEKRLAAAATIFPFLLWSKREELDGVLFFSSPNGNTQAVRPFAVSCRYCYEARREKMNEKKSFMRRGINYCGGKEKRLFLVLMLSSAKQQPIDDRRQQPSGIRTILYSLC